MSAAELMAVLLDGHLRLDLDHPDAPGNDHLIFSKGHASPLLYSCLKAAGAIEALRAAERLSEEDVQARVIDLYSVKRVDAETLARAAAETGAIVTTEDHWPEGGLGNAVLAALAESGEAARVRKLAVRDTPGSGTPAELLHQAAIDADAIADAARELTREPAPKAEREEMAW